MKLGEHGPQLDDRNWLTSVFSDDIISAEYDTIV